MFNQAPLFALRKKFLFLGIRLFALTYCEQVIWSKKSQQSRSHLVSANNFFGFFLNQITCSQLGSDPYLKFEI